MKAWLSAVLVNAPAVLLLAIVFGTVYLVANDKEIPDLFYALSGLLAGGLMARGVTGSLRG